MPERSLRQDGTDANPMHKRLPAQVVGRRRRADPPPEDGLTTLDRKAVFAMKAEQKAKWLTRVLKQAADGACRPSDLYDIIASSRFAEELPVKVGRKMAKAVKDQLALFSVKQQRSLSGEATLLVKFADAAPEAPEASSAKEETQPASGGPEGDLAEDMMARCRAFVRERMAARGEGNPEDGGGAAAAADEEAPEVDEGSNAASKVEEAKEQSGDGKAAKGSRSRDASRKKKGAAEAKVDRNRRRRNESSSSQSSSSSSGRAAKRRRRRSPSDSSDRSRKRRKR